MSGLNAIIQYNQNIYVCLAVIIFILKIYEKLTDRKKQKQNKTKQKTTTIKTPDRQANKSQITTKNIFISNPCKENSCSW